MSFCLKMDDTPQVNLPNTKSLGSFITEVNQELSVACSLPFTVPKKEIERIINYAAKWMYKNYELAGEERYYLIPAEVFTTDAFKCDRTLLLPKCVLTVHGIHEVTNNCNGTIADSRTFDGTFDTSVNKFFFRDVFFSNTGLSNSSESLMHYIVSSYWMDLVLHVSTSPISFDYNPNSNKLVILGRTPKVPIIVQLYRELPLTYLMNDEVFFRWVVAQAKKQLSRILGTFNFNLPGGITINFDLIREEGTEEITKLEEEIRGEYGADFFFMTRNI